MAKKKVVKHTAAEKKRLRAQKRRIGPSGLRRAERRSALQRKPAAEQTFVDGKDTAQ